MFSDHETARRRGRWLGLKSEAALPSERLDSTPWTRATALPRSRGTKESVWLQTLPHKATFPVQSSFFLDDDAMSTCEKLYFSFEISISYVMSEGVNHLRVTRHDCNANLRSVSHFLYTKHLQRWPVDISVLLCARKTIFTSTFRSTRNIYPLGLESTVSYQGMCGNCTCRAQV